MTSKIRILPSGHEFLSEGRSTLLEAGLSSGLALGYGCSNGNCGKCLAKIVSGEVKKVRHYDFRISAEQKTANHVLMCSNAALTDVVLEAPEANSSSEIPLQHITAKVKKIEVVNEHVALVHLKTPRTNRLRFLAGQYVLLGGDGIPAAHHSISSCPCDDMNLHFQIPDIPGDDFSDHIFGQLKKGDAVDVRGPLGDFVLDEDSPRPLVFIAGYTGFAPIRSLIEHAMALDLPAAIHLVWITQNKKDHYQGNLCRSWQDALDNFNYLPVETARGEAGTDSIGSTLDQLKIKQAELADYDFYIAGNESLKTSFEEVLLGSGLPAEQLKLDQKEHDMSLLTKSHKN